MSETRKSLPSIDGGRATEDEQVALNHEPEFRSSKPNLSKSKERVSADGAEEKLLSKEEEAKIVTRVDMADAKYHHSNGDTKIELDANKRQFSGLTKEELLKYADDPFWVRLRWFMFVLFWAMWLCMLAGAIAIIVQAPKCAAPAPRTWYEEGPLVDLSASSREEVESSLSLLQEAHVKGIFMEVPSYEVLDQPSVLDEFKQLISKAKELDIKVIVDLTANFVSVSHAWFEASVNRSGEFADYFLWAAPARYGGPDGTQPLPPTNWVSTLNESAWTFSPTRKEFYLHQFGASQADLNLRHPRVVQHFSDVIDKWMAAGASGLRLRHARHLLVGWPPAEESFTGGAARAPAAASAYGAWTHRRSADQPQLDALLADFGARVANTTTEPTVFTLKEDRALFPVELFVSRSLALRPAAAAPYAVRDAGAAAAAINVWLNTTNWPAVQLTAEGAEKEIALFAMLLPAAPVLSLDMIEEDNNTLPSGSLWHLAGLRADASVAHGRAAVRALPARNVSGTPVLACARWKARHTGYVSVFNPLAAPLRADLSPLPALPPELALHHVSKETRAYDEAHYKDTLFANDVLIPPRSTVVLSYVPATEAEQ